GFALDVGQFDGDANAFVDFGESDGALGSVALGGGKNGDGFADLAVGSGGVLGGVCFGMRMIVGGVWRGGFGCGAIGRSGGFVGGGGRIASRVEGRRSGEEKSESDG